ncbi:MAG: rod shape-determining protein MreC [Rubrobacter sp.]|nr:rod shape-determining protein MreC [Rubrobacter sp.]
MARRRRGRRKTLAGTVALCLAALLLFSVYVREGGSGPLHTVQLGAYEVLSPLREVTANALSPVSGAMENVSAAFDAGEEERLRSELSEAREQAALASSLEDENERLRRMLDGERDGYEYSPVARVLSPVGEQFTERVVIGVGASEGVQSGQPVVVGERTLIGRTTDQITEDTAEVRLVNDPNFAAGVRVVPPAEGEEEGDSEEESEAPRAEGLLRTDWRGDLGVEYVDRDARAEEGDFVVTSGRAGEFALLFPPDLLLGTVSSARSEDIDQYQQVEVEVAGRPDDAQQVRVILDW